MALLIGDSIFARLLERHKQSYDPLSISLCIRGARVAELKARVKELPSIPSPVIMLIGINDLTSAHDLSEVWKTYVSLVRYLLRHNVELFVCPLLPLANHYLLRRCGDDIERFNFWIRSLKQKRNVTVLSFQSIFKPDLVCDPSLYCKVIKNRPDYLHPNALGLDKMHFAIVSTLSV